MVLSPSPTHHPQSGFPLGWNRALLPTAHALVGLAAITSKSAESVLCGCGAGVIVPWLPFQCSNKPRPPRFACIQTSVLLDADTIVSSARVEGHEGVRRCHAWPSQC